MIDSLQGIKNKYFKISETNNPFGGPRIKIKLLNSDTGNMYCPTCGDNRKMTISYLFPVLDQNQVDQIVISLFQQDKENHTEDITRRFNVLITPSLFNYTCLQCSSMFTALIYNSSSGQELAVFPSREGALSTPNTPNSVSYYLEQANKSHSVGANSAAMAMYRAALEQLLYQQGFTEGMLGQKINSLIKAITNNTAPKWSYELDSDFLRFIKELGNAAIHSNNGEVEQQKHLDNSLIAGIKEFFKILLFLVYEVEGKKQKLLESFRSVSIELMNK